MKVAIVATSLLVVLASTSGCQRSNYQPASRSPTVTGPLAQLPRAGVSTEDARTATALRTAVATIEASWDIASLSFVDSADGWVVRERHDLNRVEVLHTADGGVTWEVQYDARDPIATALQFVDADHGWLVGNGGGDVCRQVPHPSCQGVVLATSDGGRTWNPSTVPNAALDVAFSGPLDGWVSGSYGCTGCQDVGVWVEITSDGGRTWTQYGLVAETAYAYPAALLARADATSGWIVSSDFVLSTDTSWVETGWAAWTVAPSPCGRSSAVETGVYVSSRPWSGWLACLSTARDHLAVRMYSTADVGRSWQESGASNLTSGHFDQGAPHLAFIDSSVGWLTAGGTLYRSVDGGVSWQLTPITDDRVSAVKFISSTEGWAAGTALWRTTDGGDHWQELQLPG